jgi:hypothetical protein
VQPAPIGQDRLGADPIQQRSDLFFSVDRDSHGLNPRSGVAQQQNGPLGLGPQQVAGDIFESFTGRPAGPGFLGTNSLRFNQDLLGLGPNSGPMAGIDPNCRNCDNLLDFDLNSQNGYVGGVPSSQVQRNIDPFITAPGDDFNPGAGVRRNYGTRGDIYGQNFDTYITLHRGSPELAPLGASSADLLVGNRLGQGPGLHIFADHALLGLQAGDDIDALALDRLGSPTLGTLTPGNHLRPRFLKNGVFDLDLDVFSGIDPFNGAGAADLALFSLDRDSPSLNLLGLSPADIFITDFDGTFALYASAESLGLNHFGDNIDGLDARPVPEPSCVLLLLGAFGAAVGSRRWRGTKPVRLGGIALAGRRTARERASAYQIRSGGDEPHGAAASSVPLRTSAPVSSRHLQRIVPQSQCFFNLASYRACPREERDIAGCPTRPSHWCARRSGRSAEAICL